MPNFRPTDRLTGFLMPPSVDEWLPQTHLARFVVEVVDGLDLIRGKACRGRTKSSPVRQPGLAPQETDAGYDPLLSPFATRCRDRGRWPALACA